MSILDRVCALAREAEFGPERVDDIRTATEEACRNALEHGRTTAEPPRCEASVSRDEVVITVTSGGRAFEIPKDRPDLARKLAGSEPPRGWGLYLIRRLADEVAVERTSEENLVRMRFLKNAGR